MKMGSKVLRALVTALLIAAAVTVDARLVVRMVQVAHRHGARGPLVKQNATQICGTEYPCGELTANGVEMLLAVGAFARNRYNNLSLVASPLFPSTRYNSSVVYTRSTGIQRTIQSATAFLHGLFPDNYFFPVVYSSNITTDTLLNTDPVPSVTGRRWLDNVALYAALDPVVDAQFTWARMQLAAADAWVQGLCTDYSARVDCSQTLYDVATSFDAAGRLSSAPNLLAVYPGLKAVNAAWYRYVFGWDDTNALDVTQGTAAQNLAQTIMANINAYILSPSYTMFEFSTHDTILAPLAVSFGDQGNTTMSPPYAVTIFVELLQNTANANGWYVRLIRGNPVLAANGSYVFQQSDLQVTCLDAAGNIYAARTGACPLESFARLVEYTSSSTADGSCNLTTKQRDNMGCPRTISDGQPVPSRCWVYRYVCPNTACPPSYVLSSVDLQCYPTGST